MKKIYILAFEFVWNGFFENSDMQAFQSKEFAKKVMAQTIEDFRKENQPMQYKEEQTETSYRYFIDGDYNENHFEMYLYEREILDAE